MCRVCQTVRHAAGLRCSASAVLPQTNPKVVSVARDSLAAEEGSSPSACTPRVNVEGGAITRAIRSLRAPIAVVLPPTRRVLVVAGATAEMGPAVIGSALERGYDVRALTTRKGKAQPEGVSRERFSYVEVAPEDYWNAERMTDIISRSVESSQPQELYGMVLVGAAIPPKGFTYEQMNILPLQTTATAIANVGRGCKKTGVVNISTIIATHLREVDEYGATKHRGDTWLTGTALNSVSVALRPGMVIEDSSNALSSKHAYSMGQTVACPVGTPVIGSGNQIVETILVRDLIDAALNTFEQEELIEIINAVTHQQFTQLELLQLYAAAMGRVIKPFHVAPEVVDVFGTHFPKGRLSPCSGKFFKHRDNPLAKPLCHRRFEELLGREPTCLIKAFSNDGAPVTVPKLPLVEHTTEIIQTCIKDPKARRALLAVIRTYGPEVLKGVAIALSRHN